MENNSEEIKDTAAAPEEQAETCENAETEACEEVSEASAEDKLAEELAQVKDQLLRTAAEYDNFRKRAAKEKIELRPIIITDVVKEFLPVMDNLERALAAETADEAYKQGVQMIYDSFMETMKKLGVEEIESDGKEFDPMLHQAVQRIADDNLESGTVAVTFAKGYKIGDKVIRFSMVAVAE